MISERTARRVYTFLIKELVPDAGTRNAKDMARSALLSMGVSPQLLAVLVTYVEL